MRTESSQQGYGATSGRGPTSKQWIGLAARIRLLPICGGPMNRPDRAQPLSTSRPDPGNSVEKEEESRKIRRLQIMMSMVMSVLGQDPNLTLEEASELVAGAKRAALNLFPDKELAFDLLYKPRLQRLMRERFRIQ